MNLLLESGLPLEMLFNLILVENDVRNATLLDDDLNFFPIAKQYFPNLFYSEYGQELYIVSKNIYCKNEIVSHEIMGNILGYPCASEFEDTLADVDKYFIRINVKTIDGKEHELFTNVALNFDKLEIFNNIGTIYKNVLKNHPEIGAIIGDVLVRAQFYPNIKTLKNLSNMIINSNTYDSKLKFQISHIFENIGFCKELCEFEFDLTNSFHKGVLISMITFDINNPMEKFYYYKQDNEIIRWGKSLLEILNIYKN